MSKTKFPYVKFLTTIGLIVVILLIPENYQNVTHIYIAAYPPKQQDTRTFDYTQSYSQESKVDRSNAHCKETTVSSVMASGEKEGTIAKNAIDNNSNTRWLDRGAGSYIQLCNFYIQ